MQRSVCGHRGGIIFYCSILPVRDHLDELVRLHALDAQVPVAIAAPPAINAFGLVKASDTRQAERCTLDFVAGPAATVVGRSFSYSASRVRSRDAQFFKLQVLHEFHRNRSNLRVSGQVREVDEVEISVYCWRFVVTRWNWFTWETFVDGNLLLQQLMRRLVNVDLRR